MKKIVLRFAKPDRDRSDEAALSVYAKSKEFQRVLVLEGKRFWNLDNNLDFYFQTVLPLDHLKLSTEIDLKFMESVWNVEVFEITQDYIDSLHENGGVRNCSNDIVNKAA